MEPSKARVIQREKTCTCFPKSQFSYQQYNNSFDKDTRIDKYGTIETSTCIEIAKVQCVSNTMESA